MKYFKVKSKADQIRFNNPINGWHLIANELFTEKQVEKMKFNETEKKEYFDIVNISKFKTYYWFGARWQKN